MVNDAASQQVQQEGATGARMRQHPVVPYRKPMLPNTRRARTARQTDEAFVCKVTSTADASPQQEGTFRWCLTETNSRGNYTHSFGSKPSIVFALPDASTAEISLQQELPWVEAPVKIDFGIGSSDNDGIGLLLRGDLNNLFDSKKQWTGLVVVADDVEISGIAVVGFKNAGLYVASKRTRISGHFRQNGVGIYVNETASDAIIGGTDDGSSTVIGANTGTGILCAGPRLHVRGNVFVGLFSDGKELRNEEHGISLLETAVDAQIGYASAALNHSALVIGWNAFSGISCLAPGIAVTYSVYVGVMPDGTLVPNNPPGYRDSRFDDHALEEDATSSGIQIGSTASNAVIGDPQTVKNGPPTVIVGGSRKSGILCEAPGLTVANGVYVGVMPNGTLVPNVEGITLQDNAVDAVIGLKNSGKHAFTVVVGGNSVAGISSRAPRLTISSGVYVGVLPSGQIVPNGNGIDLKRHSSDSLIGEANGNNGSPTVIGGNKRDGIRCDASRLTMRNVHVGIMPDGKKVPNDSNGVQLTKTANDARIGGIPDGASKANDITTIISANGGHGILCSAPNLAVANSWIGLSPTKSSAAGNGGDGIHLESSAVDARIGSAAFDECSLSGHIICTTAACCEDTKARLIHNPKIFSKIDDNNNNGDDCDFAARYLQLSSTKVFVDTNNFWADEGTDQGPSSPPGCFLDESGLYVNSGAISSREPCGAGWREKTNVCPSVKTDPDQQVIMDCAPPVLSSSTFPVRISANAGAGILSAAPRLAVANAHIGLGTKGQYKQGLLGNKGAGIVLEESASNCQIGADVPTSRAFPSGKGSWQGDADIMGNTFAVYIGGNDGSGIRVAGPNFRVVNTAVGLDAKGKQPAPNKGKAGIELLETAAGAIIGTEGNAAIRTWISGNAGDGISATRVALQIRATDIGFNQKGDPVGNDGYGVLVEGANFSHANLVVGTRVGASGQCGVRVGSDCMPVSLVDAAVIFPLTTSGILDDSMNYTNLNGQQTAACNRCSCRAVEMGMEITIVDCTDTGDGVSPNLGSGFFSSIPPNIKTLLMPSVKMTWIDWQMLADAAEETLEVLDISNNVLLSNPFPPPGISFPKLTTLNLQGTNLESLQPNSLQELCASKTLTSKETSAFALQSLDISAISYRTLSRPPSLTVHDACSTTVNGDYAIDGSTRDGRRFYKGGLMNGMYLYFDKDCDGPSKNKGTPRWIFTKKKPSTRALDNLSGQETCDFEAHIDTVSTTPPEGGNPWNMNCTKELKEFVCEEHSMIKGTPDLLQVPISFADDDLYHTDVTSREQCINLCKSRPECASVVYRAANGGMCDLWSVIGPAVATDSYPNAKIVNDLCIAAPLRSTLVVQHNTNRAPEHIDIKLNATGFSNLAAFAWYNKTTCPAGFYSTTNSPPNELAVLCGKCPYGTEKLVVGGSLIDCKSCKKGFFDYDNDASTRCEPSDFRVETFEHFIPADDEGRYAFSQDDNLNNDPRKYPPNDAKISKPYFGTRFVNIDKNGIDSYQTVYANVPWLIPPIKLLDARAVGRNTTSFTIDGVPRDFFINPDTGAIFANPKMPEIGTNFTVHNATVLAVDGDGSLAKVETIQFTIIPEDTVIPTNGPHASDCSHGNRVDDPKFDGHFTCDCNGTAFSNDNCDERKVCAHDETLNIDNGRCKKLQVVVSNTRQRINDRVYTDPRNEEYFAVGKTYQFSPLDVTSVTSSTGNDVPVRYLAVSNSITDLDAKVQLRKTLPAGFFIKAETGDMLVDFRPEDSNLIYNVSIQVQDDGGATFELEPLTLSVKYLDVDRDHPNSDQMGPGNKPCKNGGLPVEAVGGNPFDGHYICDCSQVLFNGDNCESQFNCLRSQTFVGGVCANFTLDLDRNHREKVSKDATITYTDPDQMKSTFYTVNHTYRISPYKILDTTVYSIGNKSNLTYNMISYAEGFFLNPITGEMQGSFAPFLPRTETRVINITLKAVDGGGAEQVVEALKMRVRYKDADVPEYGPNNQTCKHGKLIDDVEFNKHFNCDCSDTPYAGSTCSEVGPNSKPCFNGGTVVDRVPFDGKFTCDCKARFSGDNCGIDLSATEATKKKEKVVIQVIVVAMVFAIIMGMAICTCWKRLTAGKDASAALARARKAYGIVNFEGTVQGVSINSGDLVGVTTTNPAFVGLASNVDAVPLLDHGAGYTTNQLNYEDDATTVATTVALATSQFTTKPRRRRKQLSKFVAPTISLGKSTLAAKGLDVLLGVDPKTYMHVKNKVKVMLKEFAKNGTEEDSQNIRTLLDGTYKHPPNGDGSPLTPDEIRGQSITMEELMACDAVQDAGLELHHVLALRLYTTSTYRSINNPMRQSPPVLPHPFAATLYYISDALSKLREVQGKDPAKRNESLVFWRGMKDLQMTEAFVRTGGSEMACMSTTSSRQVAEDFALSKSPLLFKFVSKSFMSHGADIGFLSVYPGEKEVLYPPLTYLRPIKLYKEMIGGAEFQVAEVEPVFPK